MAYVKLRPRRATKAQWDYANPILDEGELVLEVPSSGVGTGLIKMKIGDGASNYKNLPYAMTPNSSEVAQELENRIYGIEQTVTNFTTELNALKDRVSALEV